MHEILNKKTTKALHGIAILLMIYHHIFINGNLWFVDSPTSLFDCLNFINFGLADSFQQSFAWFARICVSIFAFTSGYGIYVQLSKRNNDKLNMIDMYKYCFKRIWSFYKKYLIVFLVFVGIQYYLGIYKIAEMDIPEFILSVFGLSYFYNDTWWYVSQYYAMVLLSPIAFVFLNKIKKKEIVILGILFILTFVVATLNGSLIPYIKFYSKNIQTQFMMFLIIFVEGMFVCKYNLANLIGMKLNKVACVFIVIATFILRVFLMRAPSDSIFDLVLIAPFVVALACLLINIKDNNLLVFIGNYSTYMWFNHAYFYAVLFFDLVIRSDYSLIVFIQVVIYSLVTAIFLTKLEQFLSKILKK